MSDTLQYRMESEIIIPFLLYSVVRGLHLRSPAWATTPRLMSVWGTLKSLTRSSALRLTKILSRQEIGNSCPVTEVDVFPRLSAQTMWRVCATCKGARLRQVSSAKTAVRRRPLVEVSSMGHTGTTTPNPIPRSRFSDAVPGAGMGCGPRGNGVSPGKKGLITVLQIDMGAWVWTRISS
jgi:hypothetical protein